MQRHTYTLLDGLRGVAAVAVVMRHLPDLFPPWLMPSSHSAVDLFFVLSGFVIAHAYDARLAAGMSSQRFMVLRAIRLYPMFLLAAAVGAPLAIAQGFLLDQPIWYLWAAIPLSLLMIPSPVGPAPFPSVGAAWSLMFEMIANAIFAVAWRWLSIPVLAAISLIFGSGLVLTSFGFGTTDGGFTWATFAVGLCRVMFAFPLGVLLYRIHAKGLRLWTPPAPLLLAALLLSFQPASLVWQLTATLLVLPLIVFTAAQIEMTGRAARAALFFGLISYPIYLLHPLIIRATKYIVRNYAAETSWDIRILAGIVIVIGLIAASWLIERAYERPFRKWLARKLLSPRKAGIEPRSEGVTVP